jgi:hypothetical protein
MGSKLSVEFQMFLNGEGCVILTLAIDRLIHAKNKPTLSFEAHVNSKQI